MYSQVWKVLSSILDGITEWIFERVLLYNFLWSYADVFSRDYLRVCMLISVALLLVYKTTRHNGYTEDFKLQLYMDKMNDFEHYVMSHVILSSKQIIIFFFNFTGH